MVQEMANNALVPSLCSIFAISLYIFCFPLHTSCAHDGNQSLQERKVTGLNKKIEKKKKKTADISFFITFA